jgi:cell wall assembly regulator SMI1
VTVDELARALNARGDVVIGKGANEADIERAEQSLGVRFPLALREYLKHFGHLEVGHFELYGIGAEVPNYLELVAITVSERTESGCPLPHELVPILNDGGGNLYCIDTRSCESGRVVLWDHTLGVDPEPEQYSSSFFDWIGSLLRALDDH